MSLKYFLTIFLFQGLSITSLASPAPSGIEYNVSMAKDAVGKYKGLNDSMMGYYDDINSLINLCNQVNATAINKCADKTVCDSFLTKNYKEKITYCMNESRRLKNKGDIVHLKSKIYLDELNEEKYANLKSLEKSLVEEYNSNKKLVESAQNFLNSSHLLFQQKYKDIWTQEYKTATENAELRGKIKGNCIFLKQQLDETETVFLINQSDLDYGLWYQFNQQVKALRSIADNIRPKCPADWQPADYASLEAKVSSQLQKIDKKKWLVEKCKKIKSNKYYGDVCLSRNIGESQPMNILMGAE